MAFKYLADEKVYQDKFHFWYVNGFNPQKEMIEEVPGPSPVIEGTRMTHPTWEMSGGVRVRGKGRGPEWC